MSGGQPGSKLIVYERYPAPVFTSLHWRAEGATQKCCSIKRNKQVVAAKTQAPARALFGPRASPSEDLSSIARQPPPSPMRVFAIGIELALDVAVQGSQHPDARV